MSQKVQTTSTSASCKGGDTRKCTVMQATFLCNLSPKRWCVASCNCLLCISNHPRASLRTTNFHVAESIRESIKNIKTGRLVVYKGGNTPNKQSLEWVKVQLCQVCRLKSALWWHLFSWCRSFCECPLSLLPTYPPLSSPSFLIFQFRAR